MPLKVALLYPPPWKIAAEGEAPFLPSEGPPPEYRAGDLDADFYQTPWGLFSLGAQALRAGHLVKVINLSSFSWGKVENIVEKLDADVYGLSCWTANRRGVSYVARAIKQKKPNALVVVGGPHATPLCDEILAYYKDVDLVCLGESDTTFMEMLGRIETKASLRGLAGTAYRDDKGRAVHGPERDSIENLDTLASPHDYFSTHIVMTSRGCPWACTFCGAETTWGRGFRSHTIGYTLDALKKAAARLPVKMVQVKDDTFTTNKKRVMELCEAMRANGPNVLWSCDTRVDLLTEPLLRAMRLAGCQRLSLGVESGSQKILDAIDKKITPKEILASTNMAKKYGIKVRYYMMLGNRGETRATFEETLRFLDEALPHEYVFSCLSIYPGTRDFDEAEKSWLDRKVYFTGDFQELKTPFDASEEDTAFMNAWFRDHSGLRTVFKESAADFRAIADALGEDHHAARMDLGAALYHDGDFDGAEREIRRAMELGYPCPGLALNHLACIAKAKGDLDAMMERFTEAAKVDPQHYVLIQNVNAARAWFKAQGPDKKLSLELQVRHDFQLLERTMQPTLPGPLPDDFDVWTAAEKPSPAPDFVKTPDVEGSKKELRTRLKVM
jgi:radical SAM superfamily enzyme YgiQ (UPF0313 family)